MEPKEEPKKPVENKNIKAELLTKEESSDNSNDNISNNCKVKNVTQLDNLELNKQHFQIIQQKSKIQENFNGKNETKERIDKPKALSDKNIIDFKNKGINDNIQKEFKEIKEITKKSRSQDQKDSSYNYYKYNDNNNQTVYYLLNNYYKDIDLNFKDKNTNNTGKNFLHKNKFQEKMNQGKIPNNYNFRYNYPFIPYFYNQNYYINNNSNMYSSNNHQTSPYPNLENILNINNQINTIYQTT